MTVADPGAMTLSTNARKPRRSRGTAPRTSASAAAHTVTALAESNSHEAACASCVERIESALERSPGVVSAAVNLASEQATVVYEPQATGLTELEHAVQRAGYRPRTAAAAGEDPLERQGRARDRE